MAQAVKEKRKLVRKVPGVCALFSDGSIRLINVRLSHPHVATAQKNESEDGTETLTFSCGAYMPKTTHKPAMVMCRDRIAELLREAKIKAVASDKKFIKDGDTLAKDEAEGMWSISSRERNRPQLRGPKNDPETGKPERLTPAQAQGMFYGGCYGDLLIRPWVQNNKYGKRVNAGLVAVQFKKDGEPFGEGRISDDDVDDSFDGEDADDNGGWDDDDDDL